MKATTLSLLFVLCPACAVGTTYEGEGILPDPQPDGADLSAPDMGPIGDPPEPVVEVPLPHVRVPSFRPAVGHRRSTLMAQNVWQFLGISEPPNKPPLKDLLPVSSNPRARRRVVALVDHLRELQRGPQPRTYPFRDDPDLLWVDLGEREPSELFIVSPSLGLVVHHTCSYSHHNGDSYGDAYEVLDPQRAHDALVRLDAELERRAVDAEERRLEEAANRRRREAARKNQAAHLRNRGVL